MNYKSQWKQDSFLHENFFPDKKDGVFVEIGAHNGILGSNTYFYEKELGWSGICIEPLEERYKELIQNRSCICLNCCVYDKSGEIDFIENSGYTEMLSGIKDTL